MKALFRVSPRSRSGSADGTGTSPRSGRQSASSSPRPDAPRSPRTLTQALRDEMRDSGACPDAESRPSLRAVLCHAVWRSWLLAYARILVSAESVLFWIDVQPLLDPRTDATAARALLAKMVELYVGPTANHAINIAGTTRSSLLALAKEPEDSALTARLRASDGALSEALRELEHVLAMGIFPAFSSLLEEASRERHALQIVNSAVTVVVVRPPPPTYSPPSAACPCCPCCREDSVASLTCRKCSRSVCTLCLRKGCCHVCSGVPCRKGEGSGSRMGNRPSSQAEFLEQGGSDDDLS